MSGKTPFVRTPHDKLAEAVSVKDFGARGDGVTDDSRAINAALASGALGIVFPAGTYKANNLVGTLANQKLYGFGYVRIVKNANGPLLSHTGNYFESHGILWAGDAAVPVFTGDNVSLTGDNTRLIDGGSMWAYGRAVKSTGNGAHIRGSSSIYQTADQTATGWDIELGTAGVPSLYNKVEGISTGQATGGIKLVDNGASSIVGCQFGKYTDGKGTGPAGTGGNKVVACRVIGAIEVELPTSIINSSSIASPTINYAVGTSGCSLDLSNAIAGGCVITNAGNGNNTILQQVSTGAVQQIHFGKTADPSVLTISLDPTSQFGFSGSITIPNTRSVRGYKADGATLADLVNITSSDNINLGSSSGTFTTVTGANVNIVGGTTTMQVQSGYLRPSTDNGITCGTAANRFSTVYAGTGAINTSDAREKEQVRELTDAERRVAVRCKQLLRAFKFADAVKEKGEGARVHFGVMAQDVQAAFAAEGLDGFAYAALCFDEWPAQDEVRDEDTGALLQPAREAGNRYGVRYEELLAFMLAAL